jgi:hypothetical protein
MRERNERERLKKQQDYDDNMTEIANHSIFKNKPIVLGISC